MHNQNFNENNNIIKNNENNNEENLSQHLKLNVSNINHTHNDSLNNTTFFKNLAENLVSQKVNGDEENI